VTPPTDSIASNNTAVIDMSLASRGADRKRRREGYGDITSAPTVIYLPEMCRELAEQAAEVSAPYPFFSFAFGSAPRAQQTYR